jgi:hypothetical protein
MEHIKPIIEKKATQLAGKYIKCRCGDNGVVILNQRRFYLQCTTCGYYGLLKTFNAPRTPLEEV